MNAKVNLINSDGETVSTKEMIIGKATPAISMGRVVGYEAQAKDGNIWRPVRKDSKNDMWRMWA